MHIDKSKKFELNSPIFSQMRDDLDLYIRQCIVEMQKRDIASGAITLKIDITTMRETVADNNSPTEERNTIIPIIYYKLALNMQTKAEHKGKITDCGHEIVHPTLSRLSVSCRPASRLRHSHWRKRAIA